jgi:hypothetical protein
MSDDNCSFKQGDIVVARQSYNYYLSKDKEYIVLSVPTDDKRLVTIRNDKGYNSDMFAHRFKLKEEIIVNEVNVEKEQYIEHFTGRVYDLVFKGNRTYVLRCASDEQEVCCYESHLKSIFTPLTKEMQKQQKKNEDLGVLANVTDEIRKLLDDNHVICHANVNRDTKGLVEFNIMLGESV